MRPPILLRMLLSYSIKNHFARIWTLRAHQLWFLTFSIVPELLKPHHSSFQYHHSNHVEASGQDRRQCRRWNTPLWPFLASASIYQSAFSYFPPQRLSTFLLHCQGLQKDLIPSLQAILWYRIPRSLLAFPLSR